MNNFDQFEALSEAEVTDINGGGLLDLLYPYIIINDPLSLMGTIVDPIATGALNVTQNVVNGVNSAIGNLLAALLGVIH